jgi:polyisoprenoid-binding protein YceI
MMFHRVAIGAFALSVPGLAGAQAIDYSRSQITVQSRQMNVPVEAPFKKFNAQIVFEPQRLDASKARIEVDLASFDIGDAEINESVRDRHWFDTKQHPTAIFTSSSVRALPGGRYEARGPLTIKGRTHDVIAPFTVRTSGTDRILEGVLPIRRLQYNIGDAHWRDTSVVADEVQIKFRILQALKPVPAK